MNGLTKDDDSTEERTKHEELWFIKIKEMSNGWIGDGCRESDQANAD